jgi:uncharacterized membrane protein
VILACLATILAATGQFQSPGAISTRSYAFLVLSGPPDRRLVGLLFPR